jgi:hypothetical protein
VWWCAGGRRDDERLVEERSARVELATEYPDGGQCGQHRRQHRQLPLRAQHVQLAGGEHLIVDEIVEVQADPVGDVVGRLSAGGSAT